MGEQTVRQQARQRARRARATVREKQAQRERRLSKLGQQVAVALAERDALVSEYERLAGQALRSMIEDEGLRTQAALAWCGDEALTAREARRLIRLAGDQDGPDQEQADHCQGSSGQVRPGSADDGVSAREKCLPLAEGRACGQPGQRVRRTGQDGTHVQQEGSPG